MPFLGEYVYPRSEVICRVYRGLFVGLRDVRQCPWRKLIWILCKPQKRRISFGQKICVRKDHSRSELSKLLLLIHPGKLTWNPKMVVISRFHVNFQGCTPTLHTSPPASPNLLHLSLISNRPPLLMGRFFPT